MQEHQHNLLLKLSVILLNILFGLLTLLALPALMMSAMMFDAPGSEKNPFLYLIILAMLLLPPVYIASLLLSTKKYLKGFQYKKALLIAALPLINIIVISINIFIITIFCDGSFSCR